MLEPAALAICAAGIALSGLVRGFFGFGFGLVAVPALALVLDPRAAIALAMTLQIAAGLVTLAQSWRDVDRRAVALLAVGAVIGVPAGVALVARLDPQTVRVVIALTLLGAVAALGSGLKCGACDRRAARFAIGLGSGALNGLTGMGGPPVIVALLGGTMTPAAVRATLVGFFTVLGVLTVASMASAALVDAAVAATALLLLPLLAASTWLGGVLFRRVGHARYRPAALALLVVLAVGTLARALPS
jgi:uncharacterized membrane protein YfcA